jgi:hypothetical protein
VEGKNLTGRRGKKENETKRKKEEHCPGVGRNM